MRLCLVLINRETVMKIVFENIGIVKSIEIDLSKSLTIFCGPNNTGKTYLAYCIYALNRLFTHIDSPFNTYNIDLTNNNFNYSIDLYKIFIDRKKDIIHKIESTFIDELSIVFGLDDESVSKLFSDSKISIIIDDEEFISSLTNITSYSEITLDNGKFMGLKKYDQSTEFKITLNNNSISIENNNLKEINELVNSAIFELIFKSIFDSTFMATVERNSIFTFSKELSIQRNLLIDKMLNINSKSNNNSNPYNLLERRAKRYPLAIRDSLEIAEDLNNIKKFSSDYSFIADILEKGLLNGKLSVTKDGQLDYSPNNSRKLKIPLHISASIVKSLSSIVLYFRHFAQKGDLIIIDEPELNLHPDSQVILAKIFGIIINSGFKLIINTHSDYIIREINNLIMLDKYKDKKLLKQYNYSENEIINPKSISAYLFKLINNNGVEIEYLEVSEDGFEVETIDNVINDLNIRSQELYYKLHEK